MNKSYKAGIKSGPKVDTDEISYKSMWP
jgi:hypothetical protein